MESLFSKSLKEAIQSAGAISDRSTCAAKTYAHGKGKNGANPGRKAKFWIVSRDRKNCERELGGDVYAVKLKAKRGGREVKVDVKFVKLNCPRQFSVWSVHIVRVLAWCSHQGQPFCCTS